MSVSSSTSFSCIRLPNPSPTSPSPSSSISSSSSSSSLPSTAIKFSTTKPFSILSIRSSQTEGPLRRPVVPAPPKPVPPSPPTPPSASSPTATPQKPKPVVLVDDKNVITMEFQRQKAKELQEYFKQKKLEEADQGPFFGFIAKNEIDNGRLI
ncbi:unnamed protein product [Ilex paraguariensis]|uniref:Uncharacterized protein n=1 Tax=Ilex paraguariensis TaxID=185542 RepID=A0ABC8SDG4_9AQUA